MMFSAFERMVAMRYLRARRQEGFISVIAGFSLLGIALGVATLIIVLSVMNGFREELLSRILGLNGHLNIYSVSEPLTDYENVAAQIRDTKGVIAVTPTVEGQILAAGPRGSTGALVRSISPENLKARKIISGSVPQSSLDAFKGDDAILIGDRMAQKLGVFPGDKLKLISPKGKASPFGTVPRVRAYTVVGLFSVGMYEYDSSYIFMPLEAGQIFFQYPGSVTHIEVFVENPDKIFPIQVDIGAKTGSKYQTRTWQQNNSSFFNALQVERNVMFLILTLIILVAAFNIISSLIMLVKDKGRDIAILRTMGATRGMIMRIFLLSGASIGVTGTIAGFGLGMLFCLNIDTIKQWVEKLSGATVFDAEIYFLSRLPAKIDSNEVIMVVGMALALSFLATVYPAWRAARLDPVEALRYE
ncbi:lipoprotein-releasing ABC transporter permease subunit [Alphaproteobacteria bacterium HT1-32]|nr:lipoprotein-releasing ABC transporter permease subunit [Alphaproteobacteria bacterium HT1-32]